MSDNQNRDSFQYTYSANEQEEVKRIRSKYTPKEENKMERLQRLDAGVTRKATTYALTVGIVGALILGTGMSCCMVWGGGLFVLGIIVGVIGIGVLGCGYPLYNRVAAKERERIAPEVIALTDELMK